MRNKRVDRSHGSRQPAGGEGDLKHDGETFDEHPERPCLEAIAFALAVPVPFNHRPSRVSEMPVRPLFTQHRDGCG